MCVCALLNHRTESEANDDQDHRVTKRSTSAIRSVTLNNAITLIYNKVANVIESASAAQSTNSAKSA